MVGVGGLQRCYCGSLSWKWWYLELGDREVDKAASGRLQSEERRRAKDEP